MRKINRIVLHCAATPEGRDVKTETIRKWHTEGNGWKDIGYHFVIELDGAVRPGRPIDQVGAHVAGHNADSVGICYVGGMDGANKKPKDTRTAAQKAAMRALVVALKAFYPKAEVLGHWDLSPNKACPSFNVKSEQW